MCFYNVETKKCIEVLQGVKPNFKIFWVTKDIFYAITTTTTTIILLFIISGEHAFLECSTPVLVANQIVNAGASKSCMLSSN